MDEVRALQTLGLTQHQARAYRALIQIGEGSAYRVAKAANLPAANTYGALGRLVALGGAELLPGRPRRYRPADPESWLEGLAAELGSLARGAAKDLAAITPSEEPADPDGELSGEAARRLIRSRLEQAQELIAVEGRPSQISRWHSVLLSASRRGVQVAVCSQDEGLDFVPPAGWLCAIGLAGPPTYECLWVLDRHLAIRAAGSGATCRARLLMDAPYADSLTGGILARIGWASASDRKGSEPGQTEKRALRLWSERPGN